MNVIAPTQPPTDFEFTEAHFRQIADLALRRYGLSLAETKKPLVYSRLARRLRARDMTDFSSYLQIVAHNQDPDEETAFITALTTNVTSFFRENHHFAILQEHGLPAMARRVDTQGRARIWSAGCSSGEEAYSIAMTLLSDLPQVAQQDVRILATDIDASVVEKARCGVYPAENVASVPQTLRSAYMEPDGPDSVRMGPQTRALIRFAELNLMSDWPFNGPFDAIFCRNVAIYFDKPTQARLWERFVGLLNEGGLLFIGHSERITGPAAGMLESIGITAYAKKKTAH